MIQLTPIFKNSTKFIYNNFKYILQIYHNNSKFISSELDKYR